VTRAIDLGPEGRLNKSGKDSDPTRATLSTLTDAQTQRVADEIINTDLDLIKAKSILEATEAATNGENDANVRQILSNLRVNVAALLKQREYQVKYFDGLEGQTTPSKHEDAFTVTFLKQHIDLLMKEETQVSAHLKQLEFQSSLENHRVNLIDEAAVPRAPKNDNRFACIAAAPIVVLLALMWLASLAPVRGSRGWSGE
jgi:hypothetical protein